jgi:hypothetical protein
MSERHINASAAEMLNTVSAVLEERPGRLHPAVAKAALTGCIAVIVRRGRPVNNATREALIALLVAIRDDVEPER